MKSKPDSSRRSIESYKPLVKLSGKKKRHRLLLSGISNERGDITTECTGI